MISLRGDAVMLLSSDAQLRQRVVSVQNEKAKKVVPERPPGAVIDDLERQVPYQT